MAAKNASTLPSPPSATGMETTWAWGQRANTSWERIWQISWEEMLPLKESGIRITLFMQKLLFICLRKGNTAGAPAPGHYR